MKALAASRRHEVIEERQMNEQRLEEYQITQMGTEMQKCIEKANKEAREREKLKHEVLYQTAGELDEALDNIQALPLSQSTRRKRTLELIKPQFRIRSKLLQQKSAAKVKFTVQRKQRPIGELVRDLKSIILQEAPTDVLHSSLDSMREQPSKLVKKRIMHKFFDKESESEQWYEGQVLSFSKLTNKYRVKYDGEEETCLFLLDEILEDYSARDLVVL